MPYIQTNIRTGWTRLGLPLNPDSRPAGFVRLAGLVDRTEAHQSVGYSLGSLEVAFAVQNCFGGHRSVVEYRIETYCSPNFCNLSDGGAST